MTDNGRREEILRTAAELFATKGIGATTVRDIGEHAGVLAGSLYHYFASKNAIAEEILTSYLRDIHVRFAAVAERTGGPATVVRGLITETLLTIDEHPLSTAIYQQDRTYLRKHGLLHALDESSREVRAYWMDAITEGVATGVFRADVPAETFYRTLRDSLWASMHWPGRKQYSTAEFADQMSRLLFDGYRADLRS